MTAAVAGTFKVLARRSDKTLSPWTSPEIDRDRGRGGPDVQREPRTCPSMCAIPQHRCSKSRSATKPSSTDEIYTARGGMPVGTGGKAHALLLSGGIDSPVAGYHLMAKRGVDVDCHPLPKLRPTPASAPSEKVLDAGADPGANTAAACACTSCPSPKSSMEIHEKCPDGLG